MDVCEWGNAGLRNTPVYPISFKIAKPKKQILRQHYPIKSGQVYKTD